MLYRWETEYHILHSLLVRSFPKTFFVWCNFIKTRNFFYQAIELFVLVTHLQVWNSILKTRQDSRVWKNQISKTSSASHLSPKENVSLNTENFSVYKCHDRAGLVHLKRRFKIESDVLLAKKGEKASSLWNIFPGVQFTVGQPYELSCGVNTHQYRVSIVVTSWMCEAWWGRGVEDRMRRWEATALRAGLFTDL